MLIATEGCVQERDCDQNRGNCYREDEEYRDEARAARDWVTVPDTNSRCHILSPIRLVPSRSIKACFRIPLQLRPNWVMK